MTAGWAPAMPAGGVASSVAHSLLSVGAKGPAGADATGGTSSKSSRLTTGAEGTAAAGVLETALLSAPPGDEPSASLRPSNEKPSVFATGSSIQERTLTGTAPDASSGRGGCFFVSEDAAAGTAESFSVAGFAEDAGRPRSLEPRCAAWNEARISALEKALTSPL